MVYSSEYSDASKRPKLTVSYTIDPLVSYSYDALGRPTTVSYANGVTETNTYNAARGWLTKREYKQGATNLFYVENSIIDNAGNIKQQKYQHGTASVVTLDYLYDDLHRITEFKKNSAVLKQYDYDPNGNRKTIGSYGTFTYGNSNNRLTSYDDGTTTTFTFDRAGRVKQIDSDVLTYDAFDNMTQHGSNTYTYDAYGQRLRKTENGVAKYYVTSGPSVLGEYDGSGSLQAEYIYGLRGMVAQLDPSKGYLWLYTDHLGSTRQVGNSTMQRDYYPYGEVEVAAGNDDVPYQFTGKELDTGVGLHYFGARYYDAKIGRWLVPDPAGQYFSPYLYGGNNPLIGVDEDGRFFLVPILIGAAYGALTSSVIYSVTAGRAWTWKGFFSAAAFGAAAGAISGGIGSIGGPLSTNMAYNIVGEAASNAATAQLFGQDLTWGGFIGSLAGGAVGGSLPGFQGVKGNAFKKVGAELLDSAARGAITGGVNTLVRRTIDGPQGQNDNLLRGILRGAVGGTISAGVRIAAYGYAIPVSDLKPGIQRAIADLNSRHGVNGYNPVFRSGGLYSLLDPNNNITLGRNLLVHGNTNHVHEYVHYIQQLYHGFGSFYAGAIYEQWYLSSYLGINVYRYPGFLEGQAKIIAEKY